MIEVWILFYYYLAYYLLILSNINFLSFHCYSNNKSKSSWRVQRCRQKLQLRFFILVSQCKCFVFLHYITFNVNKILHIINHAKKTTLLFQKEKCLMSVIPLLNREQHRYICMCIVWKIYSLPRTPSPVLNQQQTERLPPLPGVAFPSMQTTELLMETAFLFPAYRVYPCANMKYFILYFL